MHRSNANAVGRESTTATGNAKAFTPLLNSLPEISYVIKEYFKKERNKISEWCSTRQNESAANSSNGRMVHSACAADDYASVAIWMDKSFKEKKKMKREIEK